MSRRLTTATSASRAESHLPVADTSPIRDAIAPAATWIEGLARVGYAAKAVLYSVVGFLALESALGTGGDTIGSRGALVTLVRQEYGGVILVVIAAGLFGYAAWRVTEALLDPARRGTSPKGIAVRASIAARGLVHAALGVQAVRLAGGTARTRGQAVEDWTARALDAPLGVWLVIAAGVAVAGYGLYQVYRAWAAKLSRDLDLSRVSRDVGSWLIEVCRFGIGARGVVFAMTGVYLARAGFAHNARTAADTGEALDAIGHQPFGEWMLAAVAAGLIAYGAYEIVQARYRVIRPA
jgi:uncharacterized protein DUF1206